MSGERIIGIKMRRAECAKCRRMISEHPRWRNDQTVLRKLNYQRCPSCRSKKVRVVDSISVGSWNALWLPLLNEFQDVWRRADVHHEDRKLDMIESCVLTLGENKG